MGSRLNVLGRCRCTLWLFASTLIIVCLAFVWISRETLLPRLGRWLDVGNRPQKVDWVMVLPGGESTRPFVAAAMVRRQLARGVLVPTNADSPLTLDGILPDTIDITRQVLMVRGVEEKQIIALDVESETTWEDARSLSAFMQAHPGDRVAILTTAFHTRRARWVFSRVMEEDFFSRLSFVSAHSDEFGADDWWRTKLGFQTYVGEYLKFVFYLVRYGDAGVWTGVVVFALLGIAVRVRAGRRRRQRMGEVADGVENR